VKIAAIQLQVKLKNEKDNLKRALVLVTEAINKGADVIVLPEMWTTGLFPELAARTSEITSKSALERLDEKCRDILLVAGTLPEESSSGILNTSYVRYNGRAIFRYSKTHLFAFGGENTYTIPGDRLGVFDFASTRIESFKGSVLICYDLRFPELFRKVTFMGAEIIFLPAQFPSSRLEHWRSLAIARAIENQAFLVAANVCGHDGRIELAGHSMIVDPWGKILAEAGNSDEVVIAEIALQHLRDTRKKYPFLGEARLRGWFDSLDPENAFRPPREL
jgi:omega-amidase